VKELIVKLDELGIKSTPLDEAEDDCSEWESVEGSIDGDGDVEMQ
jgi:hypothetical protein